MLRRLSTRGDRPGLPVEQMDAPDTSPPTDPSGRGGWLAVGLVGFAVLCCAGPALIAGGVITAAGGVFHSSAVIASGIALSAVVIGSVVLRRRRGHAADCCPPGLTGDKHSGGA